MERASGVYGSFIINNRPIIPIPFATPYDDIIILIGDCTKGTIRLVSVIKLALFST